MDMMHPTAELQINNSSKEPTCKKSSENLRRYLPFGEIFTEQRSTANYYTPYKFSGKEKDEETSYSYFDPITGKYNEGGIHPGYDGPVGAPVPKNEDGEIGFDVFIYGDFTFGDVYLSNELFDIMYRCAYPNEAMSEKSDERKYEEGGYDAYMKKEVLVIILRQVKNCI